MLLSSQAEALPLSRSRVADDDGAVAVALSKRLMIKMFYQVIKTSHHVFKTIETSDQVIKNYCPIRRSLACEAI
jgi:hypothetical protein